MKYTNKKGQTYFLHKKKTSRGVTLFYFSKKSSGTIDKPAGYRIIESKLTGLPLLKKV